MKDRQPDIATAPAPRSERGAVKRSTESSEHQHQLAALKEKDREFYDYLLETDKDLLNFQADGSDDDDEELEVQRSASCKLYFCKPLKLQAFQ